MIDDPEYKEILREDYGRFRGRADRLRERGELAKAADYYRKCAEVAGELATIASDEETASSWEDLAENLENAAASLANRQRRGAQNVSRPGDEVSGDAPDGSRAEGGAEGGHRREGGDVEPVASEFLTETPDLDFEDVGGMSELKQTLIDKVKDPLERRDLYETYDLGVANAILLYGPPGTGKTYITKALAGELEFEYIQVHADDIVSKFVGEAADNVAKLFEVAADNQPCLVFVDEIEAVSRERGGDAQQTVSQEQMVNQLLTEISDVKGEDVIVVGATNRPNLIDDAMMDRFEELIEVPLPDPEARAAIIRVHLRERPVLSERIDWQRVKELTDGFSARDIETVAAEAARKALAEARTKGDIQPITQEHLETAIGEVDPVESDYGTLE